MDEADRVEGEEEEKTLTAEELKKKIAGIKEHLEKHKELEEKLVESGESQISLTDPDARLMQTGKGADVCYNLQTAVDSKHKLIVAIEVTNACADQGQLAEIAKQTKEALGVETLEVVADGGYFETTSLKECEDAGIITYVPVEENEPKGIFPRSQFKYDDQKDLYVCPAGQELKVTSEFKRNQREIKVYGTSACKGCALKPQCTTSKGTGRRIERWIHQAVIDRQVERNGSHQKIQRQRSSLIEHVFGTLKRAMGHTYFLTKGKEKVSTEASLMALSYNFKRATTIFGVERMMKSFAAKEA